MDINDLKSCLCDPELDEDGNPIEEDEGETGDGANAPSCCINRRDFFFGMALNALIPKYSFRHDLDYDEIEEHTIHCMNRAHYIADRCDASCGAFPTSSPLFGGISHEPQRDFDGTGDVSGNIPNTQS